MHKLSCMLKEGEQVVIVNVDELPDDNFLNGDDEYNPDHRAAIKQLEDDRVVFTVTMVDNDCAYIGRGTDEMCFGYDNLQRA
jgi:hypothetical protein